MRFLKSAALAAAALLLAVAPAAHAADNYTVKDGNGASLTIKSKDVGSGVQAGQHVPSDPTGTPYSNANPFATNIIGPLPAGTNAIGSVGVAGALPSGANTIGNVGVTALPALPAGGNTIGTVNVATVPALAAGESHVGQVGGTTAIAVASFARPANTTAYAAGQLVANSTVAGSVAPLSFTVARANDKTGMIRRCRLMTSSPSLVNASFRVHFYDASPIASNGDGGTWLTDKAVNYLGGCDVTLDRAFTDGAKGLAAPLTGSEINFRPASGTQLVYALVEARAAYTPTSAETFTIALEVLQD